jgi:hypothetical protein
VAALQQIIAQRLHPEMAPPAASPSAKSTGLHLSWFEYRGNGKSLSILSR